jgi:hypothetical protein
MSRLNWAERELFSPGLMHRFGGLQLQHDVSCTDFEKESCGVSMSGQLPQDLKFDQATRELLRRDGFFDSRHH